MASVLLGQLSAVIVARTAPLDLLQHSIWSLEHPLRRAKQTATPPLHQKLAKLAEMRHESIVDHELSNSRAKGAEP